MEALARVLREGGLSGNDIQGLSDAIERDSPDQFGTKTKSWIKSAGSKLLVGGVSIGSAAAQAVLTEYLKHFFGIKP